MKSPTRAGKFPTKLDEVRSYYREILPFYELETQGRSDLPFWRRIVRRWRPRTVLELGSGLGRVTTALAQAAPHVAGIDVSIEMLARARSRLSGAGVWLAAADMRRLPFAGRFDLIAAPSDPLSHLTDETDRRATLACVADRLAPGGRFVLDALYRPAHAPSVRRRRVALTDGVLAIRESWSPLADRGLWRACYRYRRRSVSETSTAEASFTARSWNPGDLGHFFRSCGLDVEEVWGGLSGRPFSRGSARLIVVARKAGT